MTHDEKGMLCNLENNSWATETFEVAPIESPLYTILYINALQRGVAREREKNRPVEVL